MYLSLSPSRHTHMQCFFLCFKKRVLPFNTIFLEIGWYFNSFWRKWEVFISFLGIGIWEVFWNFSKGEILVQPPLAALQLNIYPTLPSSCTVSEQRMLYLGTTYRHWYRGRMRGCEATAAREYYGHCLSTFRGPLLLGRYSGFLDNMAVQ